MKKFSDLTEREVLAVAMASEEAMRARRCRRSMGRSRTVYLMLRARSLIVSVSFP